jgi:hypothetical protein
MNSAMRTNQIHIYSIIIVRSIQIMDATSILVLLLYTWKMDQTIGVRSNVA